MASPQPDYFVKLSKELCDALTRAKFPGAVHLQVALVIMRMTWGDRGKRQAAVSIGALEKATGRCHSSVQAALGDLMAENVVTEIVPPSFGKTRVLAIQKDYERWGRYAVLSADVPDFLRHEWEPEQYRHSVQVAGPVQVGHGVQNSTATATPPVPPQRTEQYRHSDPTTEKTQRRQETPSISLPPARSPKISAPDEDDWQQRADDVLARTAFPLDYQRLAELLAAGNKTGKVSLSRVVNELYDPLVEMEGELGTERMRAGLRAAITKGAANANYVRKAAEGHTPGTTPPPGVGSDRNLSAVDIVDRYWDRGEAPPAPQEHNPLETP